MRFFRKRDHRKKIKKTEFITKKKKKPLVTYHLVVSLTRLTFPQAFFRSVTGGRIVNLKNLWGKKSLYFIYFVSKI